jgi:hypothetical protein
MLLILDRYECAHLVQSAGEMAAREDSTMQQETRNEVDVEPTICRKCQLPLKKHAKSRGMIKI